ncbi:MAG: DUF1501 domain-containing protein, partial [Acidobacteria bacterium]|nr:DUF1501 domain-containing protein [Acidobacteriota bacterium]
MVEKQPHIRPLASRRDFLCRAGSGFGSIALTCLLDRDGFFAHAAADAGNGLPAARQPHHSAKARSVIWLFMEGGPSHVDLFDPKPELDRLAGQPMPESFARPFTANKGVA